MAKISQHFSKKSSSISKQSQLLLNTMSGKFTSSAIKIVINSKPVNSKLKVNASNKEQLYRLLGLRKNASANEIKEAYYKLAKECHQDSGKIRDPEASRVFAQITDAYKGLIGEEGLRKSFPENQRSKYSGFAAGAAGHQVDLLAKMREMNRRNEPIGKTTNSLCERGTLCDQPKGANLNSANIPCDNNTQDIMKTKWDHIFKRNKGYASKAENNISVGLEKIMAQKNPTKNHTDIKNLGTHRLLRQPPISKDANKTIFSHLNLNTTPSTSQKNDAEISHNHDNFAINAQQTNKIRKLKSILPRHTINGLDVISIVDVPISTAIAGGIVSIKAFDGSRMDVPIPPLTDSHSEIRATGKGLASGERYGDHIAIVKLKVTQIANQIMDVFKKATPSKIAVKRSAEQVLRNF